MSSSSSLHESESAAVAVTPGADPDLPGSTITGSPTEDRDDVRRAGSSRAEERADASRGVGAPAEEREEATRGVGMPAEEVEPRRCTCCEQRERL